MLQFFKVSVWGSLYDHPNEKKNVKRETHTCSCTFINVLYYNKAKLLTQLLGKIINASIVMLCAIGVIRYCMVFHNKFVVDDLNMNRSSIEMFRKYAVIQWQIPAANKNKKKHWQVLQKKHKVCIERKWGHKSQKLLILKIKPL